MANVSHSFASYNARLYFSRGRVSHEHWEMVRYEKEADGFDREAYEHEIELGRSKTSKELCGLPVGPSVGQASLNSTYVLKLGRPPDAAAKVQEAASLEAAPAILTGTGDLGDANSVEIDSTAKDAILVCLFKNGTDFAPTFVRVSKSGKNLSQHTVYPTLGLDSTLLQYRADSIDTKFLPAQDQYPMWYFFYGKLAVPDILTQLIALPDPPFFRPASVTRGFIKKWREMYNALLDLSGYCMRRRMGIPYCHRGARGGAKVLETENYEIVRCTIIMKDGSDAVRALTFKFVGSPEHLT